MLSSTGWRWRWGRREKTLMESSSDVDTGGHWPLLVVGCGQAGLAVCLDNWLWQLGLVWIFPWQSPCSPNVPSLGDNLTHSTPTHSPALHHHQAQMTRAQSGDGAVTKPPQPSISHLHISPSHYTPLTTHLSPHSRFLLVVVVMARLSCHHIISSPPHPPHLHWLLPTQACSFLQWFILHYHNDTYPPIPLYIATIIFVTSEIITDWLTKSQNTSTLLLVWLAGSSRTFMFSQPSNLSWSSGCGMRGYVVTGGESGIW